MSLKEILKKKPLLMKLKLQTNKLLKQLKSLMKQKILMKKGKH